MSDDWAPPPFETYPVQENITSSQWPWPGSDEFPETSGWLLNEDAALKYKLQGMRVTDANAPAGGRKVTVRYRSPEDEVTKYTPPLILIEMPSLTMAYDRMMQGTGRLPYAPAGYPAWWPEGARSYNPSDSPYIMEAPIAYDITYQLTVFTRISRDHLLPIMAELETEGRLGRMSVLNIPQDGTFRRITRLGGPEREYRKDEIGKRLFTATYVIRVPTELVTVPPGSPLATQLNLSISTATKMNDSPYYNESDINGSEIQRAFGVMSVRQGVGWNTNVRNA
jgi:hypothetical protein